MKYQRPYSEEYKKRAVAMLYDSGKSIKEVAQQLGCSDSGLGTWKRQYGRPQDLPDPPSQATKEQLQREIKQLKQELAFVTEQREILKKAAAILGQ